MTIIGHILIRYYLPLIVEIVYSASIQVLIQNINWPLLMFDFFEVDDTFLSYQFYKRNISIWNFLVSKRLLSKYTCMPCVFLDMKFVQKFMRHRFIQIPKSSSKIPVVFCSFNDVVPGFFSVQPGAIIICWTTYTCTSTYTFFLKGMLKSFRKIARIWEAFRKEQTMRL